MNSVLEILAIVCFAPNCLASTQAVIFVVSEEVTAINNSLSFILASLRIEIDVASPFMTFMSKCVSA